MTGAGAARENAKGSVVALVRLFLRLGLTAFGGPAAHIAMMHDEVVRRRRWVSEAHFLDLIGATNLIPGPNSTEMAIHVGNERAGWRGLIAAGVSFIAPAMLIVLGFAWAYVEYGHTPAGEGLLYGIAPVIIAVVAQAIVSLTRAAVKGWLLAAVGAAALASYLAGINEVLILFAAGLFVTIFRNVRRLARGAALVVGAPLLPGLALQSGARVEVEFDRLFLIFLKVGAVLYGSGYVLLAFLRTDLVDSAGWLTERQLIDAIAVGQFTPGPVFTTATFVGYVVGGLGGALLATVGIFLPSFVLVAAINPLIPRLRDSPWTAATLDGVNVAALALMAGVTWQLTNRAVTDGPTAVVAILSAVILLRFKVNSAWLVLGGAVAGLGLRLLA